MADAPDRERYRQRARKPYPQPRADMSEVESEIAEVSDLIPWIGDGYRWYDWPYRWFWWLSSGWRRALMPRRARTWLNNGVNWLIPFNENDRAFAERLDSWMHNVEAPIDEHVATPSYWVVELFPPTDLPSLGDALRRNGWNAGRRYASRDERNQAMLERSRALGGPSWWSLVTVAQRDSRLIGMDLVREVLPSEFEFIELKAVQIGQSLTAVIAELNIRPSAMAALDVEWHAEHEPILLWERPRPRSLDRHWATIHRVQMARRDMHYAARDWLSNKLPGFFARTEHPQPLLELMLFDKLDPTVLPRPAQTRDQSIREGDALRALGLERGVFQMLTSPDLPKLVLQPLRGIGRDPLGDDPTWTLWGKRGAVIAALKKGALRGYGDDENRAIANRLVDNMSNLFLMIAVSNFLGGTEERFARIRDRAGARHGKFRPRAIRELRRNFLTLSLDLATVQRDVEAFWGRSWGWQGDATFSYVPSPDERSRARKTGEKAASPESFNDRLRRHHEEWFARLAAADSDYRDILSTVASLGASADAFRTGRLALWVAAVSLVVAVATVLVSDVGPASLFEWLWRYLRHMFGIHP